MIFEFLTFALLAAGQPAEKPKSEMQTKVTSDGREDLEIDRQNAGELICKRFTDTGSRIASKKVCKTAGEWEDQRLDNADVMRTKRGAAGGPTPNGS